MLFHEVVLGSGKTKKKIGKKKVSLAFHSIEVKILMEVKRILSPVKKLTTVTVEEGGEGLGQRKEETETEKNRKRSFLFLVSGHFGEGLVQFVGNGLKLLLLVNQFI